MSTKKLNFEENLEKLEQIANQLESGDADLEQSLKIYADGVKLAKDCHAKLAKAKQKVTQIIEQNSELLAKDFDVE